MIFIAAASPSVELEVLVLNCVNAVSICAISILPLLSSSLPPPKFNSSKHTSALLLILSFVWHRKELEHDKIFIFIVDIHIHNKYPENISLLTNSIFFYYFLSQFLLKKFSCERRCENCEHLENHKKSNNISCLKKENEGDKSVPCAICFHLTKIIFVSLEIEQVECDGEVFGMLNKLEKMLIVEIFPRSFSLELI